MARKIPCISFAFVLYVHHHNCFCLYFLKLFCQNSIFVFLNISCCFIKPLRSFSYHYKKSCLPGRTWSSAVVDGDHPVRILGPPWPIRKLFFSFSRPSTATDWAKTWPMVVRPMVDDDFSLPAAKSTQICALTSMGPKCQRHWRSFFFSVAHLFELPRSSRLWFSIMGPRRQPHKTRKHWILGFFFTPDFWLLGSNFDPCPLVKRWGRLQAHGSQMSSSQN